MKPRTLDAESLDILKTLQEWKDQPRVLLVERERERKQEQNGRRGTDLDECWGSRPSKGLRRASASLACGLKSKGRSSSRCFLLLFPRALSFGRSQRTELHDGHH